MGGEAKLGFFGGNPFNAAALLNQGGLQQQHLSSDSMIEGGREGGVMGVAEEAATATDSSGGSWRSQFTPTPLHSQKRKSLSLSLSLSLNQTWVNSFYFGVSSFFSLRSKNVAQLRSVAPLPKKEWPNFRSIAPLQ